MQGVTIARSLHTNGEGVASKRNSLQFWEEEVKGAVLSEVEGRPLVETLSAALNTFCEQSGNYENWLCILAMSVYIVFVFCAVY